VLIVSMWQRRGTRLAAVRVMQGGKHRSEQHQRLRTAGRDLHSVDGFLLFGISLSIAL
jgi:hypothetical protein